MQLTLRRLEPDETDDALLVLGVSAGAAAMAGGWLASGLPWPRCVFHAITGYPCPTCGATRCALALIHGQFRQALDWNPLAFAGFLFLAVFNLYALVAIAGRLPRIRFSVLPKDERLLRFAAWAAILANWAWLIYRRV